MKEQSVSFVGMSSPPTREFTDLARHQGKELQLAARNMHIDGPHRLQQEEREKERKKGEKGKNA